MAKASQHRFETSARHAAVIALSVRPRGGRQHSSTRTLRSAVGTTGVSVTAVPIGRGAASVPCTVLPAAATASGDAAGCGRSINEHHARRGICTLMPMLIAFACKQSLRRLIVDATIVASRHSVLGFMIDASTVVDTRPSTRRAWLIRHADARIYHGFHDLNSCQILVNGVFAHRTAPPSLVSQPTNDAVRPST
jgi:hypothetical protein